MEHRVPDRQRNRPVVHRARPAPARAQPSLPPTTVLLALGGGLLTAATFYAAARPARESAFAPRVAAAGAGLLASSVLADSAMEHYRGAFKRRAMWIAPAAAALTMAAAGASMASRQAPDLRRSIYAGATLTGLLGTCFHLRNIVRRPGGLSFNNLFYRAPFGAPGALALAGAVGLGGIAGEDGDNAAAGRYLAGATVLGFSGLTAEVGLLHFRGAFHNPLMYAPLAGLPLTALATARAARHPSPRRVVAARRWLALTSLLGLAGTGLHTYGVSRNMGGFYNWTQNLFQGPPIAAPPSLAGLALAGRAALGLLEDRRP